jgi:AcrR family transcriptional regulator
MQEIAADAGLTTGAIYSNFVSKEALFLALADQQVTQRRAEIASILDQPVTAASVVGRQNLARAQISDAESVLECLRLLLTVLLASVCPRHDLVVENLLLRHQLAVLTRPTRTRRRARLLLWDKLLWVLARRFCAGWREHLTFVTPETVVRWHRQGWRLLWRWKFQLVSTHRPTAPSGTSTVTPSFLSSPTMRR